MSRLAKLPWAHPCPRSWLISSWRILSLRNWPLLTSYQSFGKDSLMTRVLSGLMVWLSWIVSSVISITNPPPSNSQWKKKIMVVFRSWMFSSLRRWMVPFLIGCIEIRRILSSTCMLLRIIFQLRN